MPVCEKEGSWFSWRLHASGKGKKICITGTVISYPDKPMEEVKQGTVLEFVGTTCRNSNVREVLLEVLHLNWDLSDEEELTSKDMRN